MMLLRRYRILYVLVLFAGVAALSGFLWTLTAYEAYENIEDPPVRLSNNCFACHEHVDDGGSLDTEGFNKKGLLHTAHTSLATGNCDLCHFQQRGDIPRMFTSVAGVGCVGCHGQVLPDLTPSGAGLRRHHLNAGAPPDADGNRCNDCHTNDPVPPPESTMPTYYGRGDVLQTDPCNSDGKEDFWEHNVGISIGDGEGLDNDGDLLVDGVADPDCGAIGPVENVGFHDPLNPERLMWDSQGAGMLYDVIRSDSATFPLASPNSNCLETGTPLTSTDDPDPVPVATVFYYLVKNTSVGDYGSMSDGTARVYTICP